MSESVGNEIAVLVRIESGFDRQSGRFIQKIWEGTQDGINSVEAELGGADSYLKSPAGGGKWTITARYGSFTDEGTVEVPVSEERLRFNTVYKSIYKNSRYKDLTDKQLCAIRQEMQAPVCPDVATDPQFNALQRELYSFLMAGVDSFPIYQPVVVVTDTASANFPWNVGFAYYGYTFSTAAMIVDAGLSSAWASNLPAETSAMTGFVFGWLKKPPEIVSVGGNKTQLVQEYEYGLWANVLFG